MSNRNYGGVYLQMTKFSKLKHQVKSNMYYIFWGACTAAVMAGQIYVGNGYRKMSETGDAISADINLLIEVLTFTPESKGYYELSPSEIDPWKSMPIIR